MSRLGTIARRTFLIGSAAIAGGVAFGWYAYRRPIPNPLDPAPVGAAALTPYVLIEKTGVTVIAPRAEMGQGVQSALAALVAEELDLAWEDVRVLHGPASRAYYNAAILSEGIPFAPTDTSWLAESLREATAIPAKFLGFQITGGSSSVPDGFERMRAAGAMARVALVGAAARRLGVDPASLTTGAGAVIAPDGARLPYTELAAEAASVPLPEVPPLRPRSEWKLLGTSLPRPDMEAKLTGTAFYTGDLRLPGMKFATVRRNPALGAPMTGFDDSDAAAVPGFERTLPLEDGVIVVATNTWSAMQAADAIRFDWAPATYPADTAAMRADLAASFIPDRQDSRMRDDGDVEAALGATPEFEAEYSVPYLAHAAMEPLTAAAWLHDGRIEVWAGNQLPTQALAVAADLSGLPAEAVDIHTPVMGGGFGRRAEMDFIRHAILAALALPGTPVMVTWSREEDMTHDAYRPMAMGRVRAKLEGGRIAALDLGLAAPSVMASQMGRLGYSLPGSDATIVQATWDQPYGFPAFRVTGYRVPPGVPVGSWRSVGASQNAFFLDTAIDELAHAAGADPLDFRMSQITDPVSRGVLEAVADLSGWGQTPAGRARGLAFSLSFGVPTAQVIEVEQSDAGLRMTGAWAVVDVGIALDPRNIEAQVQGAMIFGLSAAIRGEITFAGGRAEQQTFWDFEPLRMPQVPPITVRVLEAGPKIRGVGEPGTPPAAPALGNAIFALTGTRLRNLPFAREVDFA